MKLQNLTVIFIAIIIPVILLLSIYITTGQKTIKYQTQYDTGLVTASHDAVYAYEINSTSSEFSDSPEKKRELLKASINAFEKSLCNSCGISSYSQSEIEEYIPAIVFGMYDGFYMYAPSELEQNGKTTYKHNLKNYVYYSETLDDGTVIRYSLDTYIVVISKDGIRAGYLIDEDKYKSLSITDEYAKTYYTDATDFTGWVKKQNNFPAYLKPGNDNDPEDENSAFVQHKREIMKNKIENVLNSSITAYSQRLGSKTYKMPKLSEEDWQKIYNNISMVAFFQGKSIGLKDYNGYCVLNSTNSKEYANPNLLYFIYGGEYHDIRCSKIADQNSSGYKIARFSKTLKESTTINDDGTTKTENKYVYENDEPSCYYCINGQKTITIWNYIKITGGTADGNIKNSYWNSLFRERYLTAKLLTGSKLRKFTVKYYNINGSPIENTEEYEEGTIVTVRDNLSTTNEGQYFKGWLKNDGTLMKEKETFPITEDVTFTAQWGTIRKIHYLPGANDVTGTMNDTEVKENGGIIATCAYTRPKYSFENWNTKENGTGDKYEPGDKYAGDNDLTLYAQWSPNIIYHYINENGQDALTELTGNTINYNVPPRNGYNFIGWSSASGSKTADDRYANGKTYTGNVPLELYAVYESDQKVTINYNDTIDSKTVLLATSTATVQEDENGKRYITLPTIQNGKITPDIEKNNIDELGHCEFDIINDYDYIYCKASYDDDYTYCEGYNDDTLQIYQWKDYDNNKYLLGNNTEKIYINEETKSIDLYAVYYRINFFDENGNKLETVLSVLSETSIDKGSISYNATLRSEEGYKWVQYKNGDKIKYKSGATIEGINDSDCDINNIITLKREPLEATIEYYAKKNDKTEWLKNGKITYNNSLIEWYGEIYENIDDNDKDYWETPNGKEIGGKRYEDKWYVYINNKYVATLDPKDVMKTHVNGDINNGYYFIKVVFERENGEFVFNNYDESYEVADGDVIKLYPESQDGNSGNSVMSAMNKSVKAILNESREKIKQNSK